MTVSTNLIAGGSISAVLLSLALSYRWRRPQKTTLFWQRVAKMIPATFAYCALVVVGFLFEAGGQALSTQTLLFVGMAVVSMALVVVGEWLINDVYDKETDKLSNPDRATTQGLITDREALLSGAVLLAIAAGYALVIGLYAFLSLLGYILVNTAYSVPPFRTKAGGVSSLVTLGVMGAFGVLLGSATVAMQPSPVALKAALAIVVFMPLIMSYKDLKDVDHDQKSGVNNFATRYGAQTMKRALMVLLPVAYVAGTLIFGLYLVLPVALVFGAVVVYLLHAWQGGRQIVDQLDR